MSLKPITLSINPTYLCNFRCHFCYLTPAQLGDKKLLDLGLLQMRLRELRDANYSVQHVDLYGGEIGLLSEDYLLELDRILKNFRENCGDEFGGPTIGINTNLSKIHPYFLKDHVELSVSFDFEARQSSDRVLQNILSLNKEVSVLMLASPQLIQMDVDQMIRMLNSVSNIKSVEMKPYSQNQANQLISGFVDFEQFIQRWLESPVRMRFEFTNQALINQTLSGERNAFSDDHLYITPSGSFAVLEFDEADREFFLELGDIRAYENWAEQEKVSVRGNPVCSQCKFLGSCLTEHYRKVHPSDPSCSGFRNLIRWYQDRISVARSQPD